MKNSNSVNYSLSFLAFLFLTQIASAQIKLNDKGHVGIGDVPNESRILNILCDDCAEFSTGYGIRNEVKNMLTGYGNYNYVTGITGSAYGVYSSTKGRGTGRAFYGFAYVDGNSSTGTAYGVDVSASNSDAYWNVGLRGRGRNASNLNRGVWATGSGTNSYAGYFDGDTYATGTYEGSDERFKEDIQALNGPDMLDRIQQLQGRRYRYRTEEELEQAGMPVFGSKEGEHFGVVAQELEAIFPELVIDVASVLNEDPNEIETVMTKAVNYTGLIPVLIAGIQEQQNQIQELEARIEALENMMQE